jgi:hypothetical protein
MKIVSWIILLLFILSACQKENSNLDPYYHYLIGEWENIGLSDDRIRVKFDTKGRIKISVSTHRAMNFVVGRTRVAPNDSLYITYIDKNDSGNQLPVHFKIGKQDTLEFLLFQYINDFTIGGSYNNKFIKISQ